VLAAKGGGPVTTADLDAWIKVPGLKVTSLMDPPGPARVTLNAFGIRETGVIVDLRTMKIVKKINGDTTGLSASSINELLSAMASLLGV
jgi:hypothetical protein